MKRFAILILVLAAASVHAASYESRTPHHAVAVEIVGLGVGDIRFDVTVTDLPGGQVLTVSRLPAKVGATAETEVDVAEQHVRISVGLIGTNLGCGVDIQKGDAIIDSIHSRWSTQPTPGSVTPGDGPFRVGGDVKAPVLVHRVDTVYPEAARKARITGIVIVEARIDRAGSVKSVLVLKPLPYGLSEAAVDAVKQWTFRPGTLNGKPVDVIFNLTVNFKLDMPDSPEPR